MQIGDNLQTSGMVLKCPSVPKQNLQLLRARDESLDLHPCAGPHRMWRHNFSRVPQSQLQCSPQFSQDYHIFEPRAEDFTLSITYRGRSPSRNGLLISRNPFFNGPQKAHGALLAQCGHTASYTSPSRNASSPQGCLALPHRTPTRAGCQHRSDSNVKNPP